MRAIIPIVSVSAIALVALTGCVAGPAAGPMVSEERELTAVTALVLDTDGDVTIIEGEPGLVIHARASALDQLTSDVRDGALVLGRKPGTLPFGWGEVRYELTLPSLDRVEINGSGDVSSVVSGGNLSVRISGSGDVEFEGIDAALVEIAIDGSGDVSLGGTTLEQRIEIDGSGDIDNADLRSERATVAINGSSEVSVHVTGELDIEVSGSGLVRYSGSPDVRSDVSGSGEIVPEND
jgi:hypothetical protein